MAFARLYLGVESILQTKLHVSPRSGSDARLAMLGGEELFRYSEIPKLLVYSRQ